MNNIPCGVVKDLLPLYTEGLCGEDSRALVEAHLKDCPDCRSLRESMEKTPPPAVDSGESLKKIKKELKNRKLRTAALAALLVFVLLLTVFQQLSAPRYIPYSEGLIQVAESEDYVIIRFPGSVSRTSMEYGEDPDTGKTNYYISAYSSTWDEMKHSKCDSIAIYNGDGRIGNIYYCWESWEKNTVTLYGEDSGQGLLVLPRLVLGYYVVLALAMFAISGLLWLLFRKHKAGGIFRQIFFAPAAYLTGHVLMKGFDAISFNAGRDFVFILLAACGIYAILTLGRRELVQRKQDRA